mgnify:CR=1 FL=1
MPFGYVGNFPNQQLKNSGIFSPEDVLNLNAVGEYGGSLKLIQEQNVSSVTSVDFLSIQEDQYDVHLLFLNNATADANLNSGFQFYESGIIRTAADYQYGQLYGITSGTFNTQNSTGISRIVAQNIFSANPTGGYAYFYDLGNSSKYSFCTYHVWVDGQSLFMWGGGVSPLTSTVDGIKIYTSGTNNLSGNFKLFGVKQI